VSATSISPDRIPAGVYDVDPAHSSVSFDVRHMGIATVRGRFRTFEGRIDASAETPLLEGAVEVDSIDTGEENRDGHLKSPEFFDVAQHPQISFRSTAGEPAADGKVRLTGEITIKGISKPLELTGTIAENGQDPWGNERVGLDLEATIDRRDFDLKWNQTLPNGNLLVSNDVKLLISVSAVKSS
jgi:polyisoprenoid-binding protein YceI